MKLLDAYGRPARIKARYEAAYTDISRSHIDSRLQSATRDIDKATRRNIIKKSRYFYKNSFTYCGIIERLVAYIVGSGHTVVPDTSDEAFNRAALKVWDTWCKRPLLNSKISFNTLQGIICRSILIDADCFSFKTYGMNGEPRLQMIEAHRITDKISLSFDKPEGVKLDEYGEPCAYNYACSEDFISFEELDARDVIIHSFPKRLNEYRGVPILVSALNTLHDVDDIIAAEKQSVKNISATTGFIKTASGETNSENLLGEEEGLSEEELRRKQSYYDNIENSRINVLQSNDDFQFTGSDRPSPAWQGFMDFLYNGVCVGTGYPAAVLRESDKGSADIRKDLATADRINVCYQESFSDQLQEIYEWVIGEYIVRDRLSNPPADWRAAVWQHPPRITIDAGRESASDRADVESGLLSRMEYHAKRGADYREHYEQIAREIKAAQSAAEKYGIDARLIEPALGKIEEKKAQ